MPSASDPPEPVNEPNHQFTPHTLPNSIPTQPPGVTNCAPTLTTNTRTISCTTDTKTLPKKLKKEKLFNRVLSAFAKFTSRSPELAGASVKDVTQHTTRLSGSAEIPACDTITSAPIVPVTSDTLTDEDNGGTNLIIVSTEIDTHISIEEDTSPTAVDGPQNPTTSDASSIAEETVDQDPELDPIWGPIKSLPVDAIEKLAMEYAPIGAFGVSFLGAQSGLNNDVSLVKYHPGKEKRCIRVPASGWDGKWSQEDKDQLTRSNNIMRYLRKHTAIPVPEIFHWDTELDNHIGAPFTVMAFVDGESPKELWFEGVYPEQGSMREEKEYGFNFRRVKKLKGLERRRQKILKSLATTLAEFQHLKFDKLGSLSCADGEDGPLEVIPFSNLCYGREEAGYSADSGIDGKIFNHTIASLQFLLRKMKYLWEYEEKMAIDANNDPLTDSEDDPFTDTDIKRGLEHLYGIVLCCLPIPRRDESETFVLAPPDFGSQNIKCNKDGEITALIDWDLVDTRPHITGWCTPPEWLAMDWYRPGRYTWPDNVMAPADLERYRNDYAGYLRDACDDSDEAQDWKFTTKAPMFEAIVDSLVYQDEDRMLETMFSLLGTFLPRMDLKALLRKIGRSGRGRRHMGFDMNNFFYKNFRNLFDNKEVDYDSGDDDDNGEDVRASTGSSTMTDESASTRSTESDGDDEDSMITIEDEDTAANKRFFDVSVEDWKYDCRGQDLARSSLCENRARSSSSKRRWKSCRD